MHGQRNQYAYIYMYIYIYVHIYVSVHVLATYAVWSYGRIRVTVVRILLYDTLSAFVEGFDAGIRPPFLHIATFIKTATKVVKSVGNFMTDYETDTTEIHGSVHVHTCAVYTPNVHILRGTSYMLTLRKRTTFKVATYFGRSG
jgi:hypothetical protein